MSQSPGERPPGVPDPTDPGGSENRDLMGWQRTTMALVAVGAASARHSWSTAGVYALLPLGLIMLVAAWVLGEGWRRYDEDREGIETTPGGPVFVLAASVALVAAVEVHHMCSDEGECGWWDRPCPSTVDLTAPCPKGSPTGGSPLARGPRDHISCTKHHPRL